MNKLYILGGPPRIGKSAIAKSILSEIPASFIDTDSLQNGLSNMLINDPFQILRQVNIEGSVEFRKINEKTTNRKEFSKETTKTELVKDFIIGMLDHYRRNNADVVLEGSMIEPEWIDSFTNIGFTLRVVFVGFTNENYLEMILKHAKENENDWINEWLKNEGEVSIKNWVSEQATKCVEIETWTKKSGYGYFDITKYTFQEYINNVKNYLLEK